MKGREIMLRSFHDHDNIPLKILVKLGVEKEGSIGLDILDLVPPLKPYGDILLDLLDTLLRCHG